MGYFDELSSKMALISKFRTSRRHYDVIIGNMDGFATSLFIKVQRQNVANWGILVCTFQKTIYL